MALVPGQPLTVDDTEAVRVDDFVEADYNTTSNVGLGNYGQTVTIITSAPVHIGGNASVTNSGPNRGTLLPAGVWPMDISGTTKIYLIAPEGQEVTVERFQVGV